MTHTADHDRETQPMPAIDRPIVLVGMMGSGKTTVGRRLAQQLNLKFFDADAEIEAAAGLSVSEIFARFDEAYFRDGERRVIHRLLQGGPAVIATGGGAFAQADTRQDILDNAIAIWLDVPLPILVERTSRRNTRPLLQGGNVEEKLRMLMDQRGPFYAMAHLRVPGGPAPHARAVDAVKAALQEYLA
jgi:shikimate kinase